MSRQLLSYGDCILYESDLKTLVSTEWINDRIISFALSYLYDTVLDDVAKKQVVVLDGAVCQIMKFVGLKEVTELLDSLDIGNKEHTIFALNDHDDPASEGGSHWSLMIHRREEPFFWLIDSIQSTPSMKTAKQIMRAVTTYLALPSAELRIEKAAKQQNGSDCGIYLIEFVRLYLQGVMSGDGNVDFTKLRATDMRRQRTAWSTIIRNLANEQKSVPVTK